MNELNGIERTFRILGAVIQGLILGILVWYSVLFMAGMDESLRLFRYQGY